jgi:hypothetical protein
MTATADGTGLRDFWVRAQRLLDAPPERVHPDEDKGVNHGNADREDGGARS